MTKHSSGWREGDRRQQSGRVGGRVMESKMGGGEREERGCVSEIEREGDK